MGNTRRRNKSYDDDENDFEQRRNSSQLKTDKSRIKILNRYVEEEDFDDVKDDDQDDN
jgi:hypothetical protein